MPARGSKQYSNNTFYLCQTSSFFIQNPSTRTGEISSFFIQNPSSSIFIRYLLSSSRIHLTEQERFPLSSSRIHLHLKFQLSSLSIFIQYLLSSSRIHPLEQERFLLSSSRIHLHPMSNVQRPSKLQGPPLHPGKVT